MISEEQISLKNSSKYFELHNNGCLQLHQELTNGATVLIDHCNYFYNHDYLVKIFLRYLPDMTMIEFGRIRKLLDYQTAALREGETDVRLC